MKKIFLILIIFVISGFVYEVYQYRKQGGNLIIYLCNCSDIDSLNVEVFVNDKKIVNALLSNNEFHHYEKYVFKTNFFKTQLIEVKSKETDAQLKFKINTCLVKRVLIEFWGSTFSESKNNDYEFIKRVYLSDFLIQ